MQIKGTMLSIDAHLFLELEKEKYKKMIEVMRILLTLVIYSKNTLL